jgi:hypothetical protein
MEGFFTQRGLTLTGLDRLTEQMSTLNGFHNIDYIHIHMRRPVIGHV